MTEVFTISENFSDISKKIITKAVKLSKLPEGITVVCWDETANATKPFVVIAHSPRWEDSVDAFQNGALNYVSFSVDPTELAKKLDS